ncbi:hypothetical protein V5799_025532 [Amblyomma americanum]|uniref:THAP-type domain-containing protein n=1 Tax=Amblyomma americanum TaxID=6943 RepID=A0AAQ4E974_AMBAM
MPGHCCVPGCRGNYDGEKTVRVFTFPADADRRQWLKAIPRADFEPGKRSVVCERHFKESDVRTSSKYVDSKTVKVVEAKLKVLKTCLPTSQGRHAGESTTRGRCNAGGSTTLLAMCRMEWPPRTDRTLGQGAPGANHEACSSSSGCPRVPAVASKQPLRSVLLACRHASAHEDDSGLGVSAGTVEVRHLPPGVLVQLVPQDENHFHLETADTQSVLSLYVQKDFRYFLQHPYARLFVSYFVIFCNFLVFAEDPISHSRTESEIPVFGNVFSFVCTKYPPEWGWRCAKVLLWLLALFCGLVCGKYFIHRFLLRNLFRLKMFREEQGTWMIMLLTVLVFVYMLSLVYNALLLSAHPHPDAFRINALMGVTNASFMKVAACGTWLGDFLTAWMVTDMMLQDELYPGWAPTLRAFWQSHGRTRIVVFWSVALLLSALVVSLIVSDRISWDYLNREFVATTELSRAFLASFILVMDLLIVMQVKEKFLQFQTSA